ncbi:MAG TPA: DUF2299 family protein [Candidatus Acidoferrum sp.]|nr:DUF2299 family protein [Candidatus Acidoferrum sp.]
MDWKAIWQGLLSNLLSAFIIAGGGIALAYLEATHSRWAAPLLFGLGGSAIVSLLIFSLTGRPPFSRKQPQTTVDNVEANIRAWLDYFGLGVQKRTEPDAHFAFIITCRSGMGLYVARFKARDRYIVFGSNIEISAEHRQILTQLSKEKSGRIAEELALELARTGVGYSLEIQPDGTMTKISLQRAIPITPSLTEDTFIAHTDQMESNAQVAREVVRLAVDNAKQRPPSPAT